MKRKLKISIFLLMAGLIMSGIIASSFVITGTSMSTTSSTNEPKTSLSDGGTNSLSYSGLEPGDYVVLGNPGSFFDYLIPGEFGHSVMFCGTVESGQYIWDRDHDQWMAEGTPYVIHSTKSDEAGNGLGYSKWSVAVNDHAENAVALEVDGLTSSEKADAMYFLKNELDNGVDGYPVGPKYDWGWTCKQVDADEANGLSGVTGYYCSEAIWAAYKSTAGIDLDPAGDDWDWSTAYGVSPTDIYDDSDASIVSSQGWDPDECYYVSVWVEGIYYDDDYAPWTEGSDEQYYKYAVGDDWGGSGYKTGDGRNDQRSSDDNGEHVMWNEYLKGGDGLNMMIPKTHPLTIGIEAWEADGFLNSDDQYPVFDWSTEDMENFVFKPDGEDSQGEYQWDVDEDGNQYKWRGWWWWNYWDAGDCRYCIMFTVQDEPIDASDCPGYSTEYYA